MAESSAARRRSLLRRRKPLSPSVQEAIAAYVLVSPWLLHLVFLTAIPVGASLYFSFCSYQIVKPARFWGLVNYVRLFTEDLRFSIPKYPPLDLESALDSAPEKQAPSQNRVSSSPIASRM